MPAALHEQIYVSDLLKYEEENRYSRDTVTVAAGQNLLIGTVLGMRSGKVVALDPLATDGSEKAVGVLIQDVTATVDTEAVMVSRNVLLSEPYVVWPAGLTTSQKLTAVAELNYLGIVLRIGA
jgi:mRNA degradation ribonuclease J1/J2